MRTKNLETKVIMVVLKFDVQDPILKKSRKVIGFPDNKLNILEKQKVY